jgi:adenosine 3'-phospho 5'-phosphosulfate transporter B2
MLSHVEMSHGDMEKGSANGLERDLEKERLLASSTPPPATGSGIHSGRSNNKHGTAEMLLGGSGSSSGGAEESMTGKVIRTVACFVGLQASYITWGLVQERIVTKAYGEGDDAEFFPSSTFLVFGNRFLALFLAAAIVFWPWSGRRKGAAATAAAAAVGGSCASRGLKALLLQYAPASLSNILSSWAQYEALKYISFPTQVLSKSSKIIPVILVGRLLHRKSYPWSEYAEAAFITLGVTIFSLNEKKPKAGHEGGADSMIGYLLLALYLACDSFTSQWQDKVFKKFHVSQFQMMLGVNLCSIIFTGASLLQTGQGGTSWAFITRHPDAAQHVFLLSLSSATGQLFIFYTIKQFGAIVFTIMMTTRQMLSMLLSCLIFAHPMAWPSFIGAMVCFTTIGVRIQRSFERVRSEAS